MTKPTNHKVVGNVYRGRIAEKYEQARSESKRWKNEHASVERLLQTIPDFSSVLDIPFGTGRFFPIYEARNFNVTAADISLEMMAQFDEPELVTIVQADARDLSRFSPKQFEASVCVRFLQNIVSKADASIILKELARVSKTVIAEVQVRNADLPPLAKLPDTEPMREQMTFAEVGAFFRDAGLAIEEAENVYRRKEGYFAMLRCRPI
jgi:ubiquinone/menaquinone biosynthesis C-methylase UbiE